MSKSVAMARWAKQEVWDRAGSRCERCGTKGKHFGKKKLSVHHTYSRRNYPELVNRTDLALLLCNNCHREADAEAL